MPPSEVEPAAVVVIGGGFGGLNTALQLAASAEHPSVVLLEPREHFLFLPLLYELLSAELKRWEIAPRYSELLAGSGVVWIQERAARIDRANRTITTDSGRQLPYSSAVIASGGQLETCGVPGVREHAVGFRTLEDVAQIQGWIEQLNTKQSPLQRIGIVGAGASGVELACKLADLLAGSAIVELVEQGPELLPIAKAFNREQAREALQQRDIRLRLNTRVASVEANGLQLQRLGDGTTSVETLRCDGVIWTAGLAASVPELEPPLPLDPRGRLRCAPSLQVEGSEDLFVLGDAAACPDPSGEHPSGALYPANAQVAYQQASCIARNLQRLRIGAPLDSFIWKDLGEMMGLGIGQASLTGMGVTLAGPAAFQLRRLAYLARMPGLPQQLKVAGGWLAKWL